MNLQLTLPVLLAIAVAASCAAPSATPSAAVPAPPAAVAPVAALPPPLAPAPTGLRLPTTARPLSYALALDVDPAKTTFAGRVSIEVELSAPAHPLWLNAEHLTIDAARLRTSAGAAPQALRVVPGPDGVVGLAADAPIAPGRVTLELEYRGRTDFDYDGLTRHEDRGDWYLVTHLEPQGARRVMPCFDEPGFKVPWQLELTVPDGQFAASNTPIEHEQVLADGRRRVTFAPTAPMPSYLFAIGVGPFEAVDAGTTRGGAPVRIIVPRGRGADAAFVAKHAVPIVSAIEDYTGIPYPSAKLDHIVFPGTLGGAMENLGLITYAQQFLLIPENESDATRRAALDIMAHEVSHQWFGDLVTMAWFDDLWLSEAFATWSANRVMAERYGALGGALNHAASRLDALDAEGSPTARAIHQPIVERVDIRRAFDLITYEKGATVLRMFEQALGTDVFRAGVRTYLAAHRDANATAADFIAALSAAAHRDLTPALSTWLDRPGAPVISMEVGCPAGGPAVLELSQHRYQATAATTPDPTTWHVPVCVRVPGERQPRCTMLTERTGRIDLGPRCPALVVPVGDGHYRAAPSAALRKGLVAAWSRLNASEQAAFASDTAALVDAAELDLRALLDLLPHLGTSANTLTVRVALDALERLAPLVAGHDRPAFQRLVLRSIGKLARRTGWLPRAHEDLVGAATRRALVSIAAELGRDPVLARSAIDLTRRWLDDHTALPRTLWGVTAHAAMRVDEGALFELFLARLATEPDVHARRVLAYALGSTHAPALLERALDQVAAQPSIAPELLFVFFGDGAPETTAIRLAFLRRHAADVLAKVPADLRRGLAPSTCLADHRAAVLELLDAHFVPLPDYGASTRNRDVAAMDACIARRAKQAPRLAAYLARYR